MKLNKKDMKIGRWVKVLWADTGEDIGIIIGRSTVDLTIFFPNEKEIRDDVLPDMVIAIGNDVDSSNIGFDSEPEPVSPKQKKLDRHCV